MYSAVCLYKGNAESQRSLEIVAVFMIPSPIFTSKSWNFEFPFGGIMDQNVLFQMTPNLIWFVIGINFRNCFKDDFGEKNWPFFDARPFIMHAAPCSSKLSGWSNKKQI